MVDQDFSKEKVLIVDDEINIRHALSESLRGEGFRIDTAEDGETAWKMINDAEIPYNVMVTDVKMNKLDGLELLGKVKERFPDTDVLLITAFGTIETAVHAVKQGAYDYLTKPLDLNHFRQVVRNLIEKQSLLRENIKLREILNIKGENELVIGTSKKVREVYDIVNRVADTDVTVLIEGESGTGKDVVARSIHNRSSRHDKPFIIINCGALPESLLENELFGHERDAYTGAVGVKQGRFELANGGTLFLDEVTEMGKNSQADFLRVLEDNIIFRIGGTAPIKVDVRIIAATNKNLRKACEDGSFREDLYYRLNVVSINMPLLRDRQEDIPILVQSFLREFTIKHRKAQLHMSDETMKLLINYPWPGNVRELRNAVERAVILGKGSEVLPKHFPPLIQRFYFPQNRIELEVGSALSEVERVVIQRTLESVGGHRRKASQILGISLRALQYKIKEFALEE